MLDYLLLIAAPFFWLLGPICFVLGWDVLGYCFLAISAACCVLYQILDGYRRTHPPKP